jgi:hypothetical protein
MEDDLQERTWLEHDLSRFDDSFEYIYEEGSTSPRPEEEGVIERVSGKKGKRMDIEFIDALNFLNNNLIYRKNEIDYWTADDSIVQGEKCCDDSLVPCDCKRKCICGQHIYKLYYINNKAIKDTIYGDLFPKITCLVGSCCVQKTSTTNELYNRLTKDRCKVCDETLLDRRKEFQKDGYCSQKCSWWPKCGKWPIAKGKTTTYHDLCKTNIKYAEWCLKKEKEKIEKGYGSKTLKYYLERHLEIN